MKNVNGQEFTPVKFSGQLLRNWREKAGLTQKQLAEACGLPPEIIYDYENHRATISANTAFLLAGYLDIFINDLFE